MSNPRWARAPFLAQYAYEADGQGRTYRDPFSEEKLPSVTTVLRNTPKADLMGWAALKVAETAVERYVDLGKDPDWVMAWLPYAHTDFRNERAEIGTSVHQWIQAEHDGTWDFPPLDAEGEAMLEQWRRFVRNYNVEIILNEFSVFGDGYAGTADLLIRYTDPLDPVERVSLVDIKTSRNLWESHFYQVAGLSRGEFWARRVDSGTPDSVRLPKKADLPESFWVKEAMPEFDALHVLQIRDSFYKFEPVEHVDENYAVFKTYVDLWYRLSDLKGAQK